MYFEECLAKSSEVPARCIARTLSGRPRRGRTPVGSQFEEKEVYLAGRERRPSTHIHSYHYRKNRLGLVDKEAAPRLRNGYCDLAWELVCWYAKRKQLEAEAEVADSQTLRLWSYIRS